MKGTMFSLKKLIRLSSNDDKECKELIQWQHMHMEQIKI